MPFIAVLALLISGSSLGNQALDDASAKIQQGDYLAARLICEALLKQTPRDQNAKSCVARSKAVLEGLAEFSYEKGSEKQAAKDLPEALRLLDNAFLYSFAGDEKHELVEKKFKEILEQIGVKSPERKTLLENHVVISKQLDDAGQSSQAKRHADQALVIAGSDKDLNAQLERLQTGAPAVATKLKKSR